MPPNPYKEAAQTRKVMSMVAAIDRAAVAKQIDPFFDAEKLLTALEKYGNENWSIVDKVAQLKNKSSDETREMVKNVYRERSKEFKCF